MTAASLRPSLAMLVAISALQPIALNLLAPATPILAREFATSYATIQLTLTLFLVAVALTQLVIGPLSDRFGRRPCVIASIALFVAGSVLGVFAETTGVLLVARALEGAGSGAAFAMSRAIIRDTAGRDETAGLIATVTMVMVVAPMLSPYVGGRIEGMFGWRAIFWFLTGAGVIVLAMTLANLRETAPRTGAPASFRAMFGAFPQLIADRDFVANVVAGSMTTGAFFAFVAAAPFIVIEVMGRAPDVYGAWFMINALGYIMGNFAMSRLAGRYRTNRLVTIGLAISTVAMALGLGLALSPAWSPLTLFLPLMLNAFGNGLTIPGSTAEALSARPELAGAAAGLMGAVQLGVGALATVVVSWLVTLWPPALIAISFAMTAFALAALRFGGLPQRR